MNISECSSVKFWLNKACESEGTRKGYLSKFRKFCDHLYVNPDKIVEKWKTVRYIWEKRQEFLDTWSENVEKYIYNELKDFAPLSKATITGILLSFFKHHKIILEVEKQKHPYVKYHNRDITREEIKRILDHCSIRNKAFFLMMLESGLRPDTIVQLRYRHIEEDFKANTVPMKIDVPAGIVKDRVGNRFTLIGEDAFKALKEYLSIRIPLKDDDFVFVREKHGKNSSVTPSAFSNIFCTLVLKLGLDKITEKKKPKTLKLYCLRKYFRNNMKVQDTNYRKFWMGRSFKTDEHYLTRDIEKHRKEYAKAYPSIQIYQPETELSPRQVEKLKQKLAEEIEAKIRVEYEGKLKEQVKETVKEEFKKHIAMPEVNTEYRHLVEDFVHAQFNVKPQRVSYNVAVSEDNLKTITVLGYWRNGKYVKLEHPAKIVTH